MPRRVPRIGAPACPDGIELGDLQAGTGVWREIRGGDTRHMAGCAATVQVWQSALTIACLLPTCCPPGLCQAPLSPSTWSTVFALVSTLFQLRLGTALAKHLFRCPVLLVHS